MKMFYEKDADVELIKGKKIAIFGYGSQGHAHALNLKDSGVKEIVVALREGSSSVAKAESKGLKVMNLSDAAAWADVVMILTPDELQAEIYKNHIMSGRETIKQLMEVFKKYKVDYVCAGHIHGYARAERDGIVYVVTGGAGAPLYLPREFGGINHYVKIWVAGDKISDEVLMIYE